MPRFDVVIFGATGFTGKNTLKYVDALTKDNGRNYTWAVAGRSESKLQAVLKEISDKIEKDLSKTPLIIADVNDEASLVKMAQQARMVINICGPYKFFGEAVVKACVENGCHHVDVSGEPLYIETMLYKYDALAKEKGVYIVSACGFDSVPCDLGLIFLQSKFEGTINSVETYMNVREEGSPTPGASMNTGTWESAVHGVGEFDELKSLRAKLFPTKLPKFQPKLALRGFLHKSPFDNKYAMPFMGSDRSIVQRTQRYLFEEEKKRPVQIGCYFTVESIFYVLVFGVMGAIFMLLTKIQFGRTLLLKYPSVFSLGMFSKDGPSEEKIKKTRFSYTLMGEGWSSKMEDPNEEFTTKPDKKMTAQVSGANPAYGATCLALTVCALTILDDPDKLPKNGGVFSTGAIFHKTSIIDELHKNGMTFDIIDDKK